MLPDWRRKFKSRELSSGFCHLISLLQFVYWNRECIMPRAWFFRAVMTSALALELVLCTQKIDADETANLVDSTEATLDDLGIKPFEPRKDANSDFIVGGKNPTALIEKLNEINGRPIADLEHEMR